MSCRDYNHESITSLSIDCPSYKRFLNKFFSNACKSNYTHCQITKIFFPNSRKSEQENKIRTTRKQNQSTNKRNRLKTNKCFFLSLLISLLTIPNCYSHAMYFSRKSGSL